MRRTYNLMVGERTAEDIKIRIGSAYPLPQELSIEVKGRDLVAGLPKTVTIRSEEVREALTEQLNTIVDAVRTTLERCPPELAADLVDRGIVLAGGGALLRGLDQLLHEQTGLPIHIAEDPLSAVAEGTGKALQELDFFTNVTDAEDRRRNLRSQRSGLAPAVLPHHINASACMIPLRPSPQLEIQPLLPGGGPPGTLRAIAHPSLFTPRVYKNA